MSFSYLLTKDDSELLFVFCLHQLPVPLLNMVLKDLPLQYLLLLKLQHLMLKGHILK